MEGKDGGCDILFFICSLLQVSEIVGLGNKIGVRREHWNDLAACIPIIRMIFLIQLRDKQTRGQEGYREERYLCGWSG